MGDRHFIPTKSTCGDSNQHPEEIDPYQQATNQLMSMLAGLAPASAAEIGCGYAGITQDIARSLPAEATLYAIDIDPEVFPGPYDNLQSGKVVELVQDVYRLELPTQVEAIISRFLLLDLVNPLAAVTEMRRWIRPGGRLFLVEPITSTGRVGTSPITSSSDEIFDPDMGLKLYDLLTAVGAKSITIDAFTPVGLGESLVGRYLAEMTGVDPGPATFITLPTLISASGDIE